MTYLQEKIDDLAIEGVTEPIILRYFETLNAGDFTTTANLFAADGELNAPFEEAIIGRDAIVSYLATEAKGMKLQPRQGVAEALEDDRTKVSVAGKVHTSIFSVNVAWQFILTADREIASVKVKLLASPQELLKLRR